MSMYTEAQIISLRAAVSEKLSDYRLKHTLGVEEMAVRLGTLYCPEKLPLLRAAALLHDITKELPKEKQLTILAEHGVTLPKADPAAPATWHAVTAALVIPSAYDGFADPELLAAVRYHTTGRADMSLPEKLIYLADYIEDGRTFDSCVTLRKAFFNAEPQKLEPSERLTHLNRVLLRSFDLTLSELCAAGQPVSLDTVMARNSIIFELKKTERESIWKTTK